MSSRDPEDGTSDPRTKYENLPPPEARLVGLDTAAEMLSVSRTKAYQLAMSDELERVRIGRRLLVTTESLDAYVARLRDAASS